MHKLFNILNNLLIQRKPAFDELKIIYFKQGLEPLTMEQYFNNERMKRNV